MAEMSNFLEDRILDHILRGNVGGTGYPQPSARYLALHTSNPTDSATGAEMSGGGYARQYIEFGAASFGLSYNSNQCVFVNLPTATVSHVAIWDSSSGGNMLFHSPLSSSITFNSGDEATVAIGSISVGAD